MAVLAPTCSTAPDPAAQANLALRYEDLDEAVIRDSAFVSVGGAMALSELDGETGSPEKMA